MKTANFKFLLFTVLFITSISIIGWNRAFDQVNDTTRLVQAKEPFDISSDNTPTITHRSNIDYSDFINPNLPSRDSNSYPFIPDSSFLDKPMFAIESVQVSHDPISITGNSDISWQSFPGNGTLLVPYLIQSYEIIANNTHLISIRDTTVYFIIKDCHLDGITGLYNGIDLVNVTNGFITVNDIGFSAHGIRLDNSDANNITLNTVHNNTANGIFLINSENNLIGNNLVHTSTHGISLTASWSNIIEENWAYDNRKQGIAIYDSSFLDISGNTVLNNNWKGIIETQSINNTIIGNFARFNGHDGIYSYNCNYSQILYNMAYNNTWNGIVTQGSTHGLNISYNYAYNNPNVGLRLEFLSFSTVESNLVYQNMEMGIWLFHSSNNQIKNNDIYSNSLEGIFLENNSDNNIIRSNTLNENNRGIRVDSSTENIVELNSIDSSNTQGILVLSADTIDINNNLVTNSWGSGMWLNDITSGLIHENDLFGNIRASLESTTWAGSGITAAAFGGNISGNVIASNFYWGIYIMNSGEHDISHNVIVNNSDSGLVLENVNGSTFNDNEIVGNLANGILLNNSNGNQILYNVIAQNGANGISIINSDSNYIHDNEIFENFGSTTGFPIRYSLISAEDIENNVLIGQIEYSIKGSTSGHGIFLDPSTGNIIEFNNIYGNSGSGAYLLEADRTEFSNNFVKENGENGVFLENSSYNTLFKNTIIGNGYRFLGTGISNSEIKYSIQGSTSGHGIFLDPSHHNVISENEISHNFANGISLFESSDSTIVGNTITKNSNGIYLEDSNFNNLSHNTVSKNGDLSVKDSFNSDIQFSITGSTSGHGIFLDPSNYNLIEHNFVFGNEGHGIFLMDSDFTKILKNSLSVNGFYGVYADLNSDESIISLNDFKHNNFGEGSQAYDDGYKNLFDENYWSDLFDQDSYKIDGLAGNSDNNPADSPFFPAQYDYSLPEIIHPNGGETLSGVITIDYYGAHMEFNLPEEITHWLFYSSDAGTQWIGIPITTFSITTASDGQKIFNFDWNTETVPDGPNYLIQVVAVDKSGYVLSDTSDKVFQVKNGIDTTDKTTTTKVTDTTTPSLTPSWTIIISILSISSYGLLSIRKRQRKG